MPKLVPPTTKNSPKVVTGKNRDNKPAEAYASRAKEGLAQQPMQTINDLNPSAGGVSKGNYKPIKTDGVKQRGHGAAVKGFTSRGPLA